MDLSNPPTAKLASLVLVNPGEFFVSGPHLDVSPRFSTRFDLSPCLDDPRELNIMFPLPRDMDNSKIVEQAGGLPTLKSKRTTPPQLMREVARAQKGESKIFAKGNYYLLYLEDFDGVLCPVIVDWSNHPIALYFFSFDLAGNLRKGVQVCGN